MHRPVHQLHALHGHKPWQTWAQAWWLCRTYWSWVLAMLMGQQNMQLQTYPKVMFKVDNFSSSGYSCMADKVRSCICCCTC